MKYLHTAVYVLFRITISIGAFTFTVGVDTDRKPDWKFVLDLNSTFVAIILIHLQRKLHNFKSDLIILAQTLYDFQIVHTQSNDSLCI